MFVVTSDGYKYVGEKGLVAMPYMLIQCTPLLVEKAGVTPYGFETHEEGHMKSKIGVISDSTKWTLVNKKCYLIDLIVLKVEIKKRLKFGYIPFCKYIPILNLLVLPYDYKQKRRKSLLASEDFILEFKISTIFTPHFGLWGHFEGIVEILLYLCLFAFKISRNHFHAIIPKF